MSKSYEDLKPSDQHLYDVLESNIVEIRQQMLVTGHSSENRSLLFNSLNDCKNFQTALISEIQSSDDTQAVNLRSYQAHIKVSSDLSRPNDAPRSSDDTQDIDLRAYQPKTSPSNNLISTRKTPTPRSSEDTQAVDLSPFRKVK